MMQKKRTIWQVLICIGLLCVIWGGYILVIRNYRQQIDEIREDDFSWITQVEKIENKDGKITITGFAFKLNKSAKEKAYAIVLRDMDTDKFVFPKMEYVQRADVNRYFLCDYDYSDSGFIARIDDEVLRLEEKNYEVLVKPYWDEYAYQTGLYLAKGEMLCTNPENYVALDTEGTELDTIIKNGILRVYEPNIGVYVYQLEETMYWVFEKDYAYFNDNGDMWLQYILYTTQNEKLPKEQLEINCLWNNSSFSFKKRELSQYETEKYRVVACEMPKEHSVTFIQTGHYAEEWYWRKQFRPWYNFGD